MSWLKTRLTNAEQRFRIAMFNCVIDVVTSQLTQQFTAEQYRSKVFRYFASVLSSVPEHDIVSQVTALQKEYSCDLSDAFPVQLSTTMHSLQLCRANNFGGLAQGPQTLAPLRCRVCRGGCYTTAGESADRQKPATT